MRFKMRFTDKLDIAFLTLSCDVDCFRHALAALQLAVITILFRIGCTTPHELFALTQAKRVRELMQVWCPGGIRLQRDAKARVYLGGPAVNAARRVMFQARLDDHSWKDKGHSVQPMGFLLMKVNQQYASAAASGQGFYITHEEDCPGSSQIDEVCFLMKQYPNEFLPLGESFYLQTDGGADTHPCHLLPLATIALLQMFFGFQLVAHQSFAPGYSKYNGVERLHVQATAVLSGIQFAREDRKAAAD